MVAAPAAGPRWPLAVGSFAPMDGMPGGVHGWREGDDVGGLPVGALEQARS